MFNFIDFAAVIVFLVTMFDDSTQLVTVPRSSSDPIAELCRALVVLKRERYHIREVFKLSSDGHAEKVYWYGRSQYIEALNAPHHINGNVSCYTDYASGMRLKTPCKLDYDTHRVFDIVAPCNDEEDDVVVKRSILLPSENDGTVREVQIFDLDSGVGEQVATIGGQYGILLTVLYDRDWILDTVETFHPNVSESSVVELFGAALPCIANAMSDDLRDSLKDNGAARMRDDIHILYGQNTDVDGHEIFVFVPFNPDSDICAKAVRIIEKYLNVNACGKNMMRCIRALVEAADINSLINN